jgi:hypothetical protein
LTCGLSDGNGRVAVTLPVMSVSLTYLLLRQVLQMLTRLARDESQLRSRLRALREDGSRAQTADDVLGLLDRGRLQRVDRLGDLVGRGSEAGRRSTG